MCPISEATLFGKNGEALRKESLSFLSAHCYHLGPSNKKVNLCELLRLSWQLFSELISGLT